MSERDLILASERMLKLNSIEAVIGLTNAASGQLDGVRIAFVSDVTNALPGRLKNGDIINTLLGWPEELIERWHSGPYVPHHPGYQKCQIERQPFWTSIDAICCGGHVDRTQRECFNMLRDLGLHSTVFVPLHHGNRRIAAVSWSSGKPDAAEFPLEEYRLGLFVFSHALAQSIARWMPRPSHDYPGRLSQRQFECLRWIANGKTSEEVAIILGLSPHTVREHIANVIRRLGASNIAHAVAIAVRDNLLSVHSIH